MRFVLFLSVFCFLFTLSPSNVQEYGEPTMLNQPARKLSSNSASISGVPQPSPAHETPLQDPVTEEKDPCKEDFLSIDDYYEDGSSNDPCTRGVTTTTEGRKKKPNAVAPIRFKNCRFCRLYQVEK